MNALSKRSLLRGTTLLALATLCPGEAVADTIKRADPKEVAATSEPATLAEVNRALEGRRASLDLAGGRKVTGARKVSIAGDFTTWNFQGEGQSAPTAEVLRITVESRTRVLKKMGQGAAIGVGVGLLAVGTSSGDTGTSLDPAADGAVFFGSAVAGAVVGLVVGVVAKGPAQVVYEAPVERSINPSVQGGGDSESEALNEYLENLILPEEEAWVPL